jgi:hypothetical protein
MPELQMVRAPNDHRGHLEEWLLLVALAVAIFVQFARELLHE